MTRLHGLDALRAAMMLLGLVLHSALNYTRTPLGGAWPFQDRFTSGVFDVSVFVIHQFRMPAFFVIAGFFGALLYAREGPLGMWRHRLRRILLPLVAAWFVMFPLTMGGFVYANAGGGFAGFGPALSALGAAPYADAQLIHLWFLHFLLIFSTAAAALGPVMARADERWLEAVRRGFARWAPDIRGCLVMGLVTGATMVPMAGIGMETSTSVLPALRSLVAYAVFFGFGWLMFERRDVLAAFAGFGWRTIVAGLAVSLLYLSIALQHPFGAGPVNHVAAALAAGISIWLLVYGILGVFVGHFESPRPAYRYLADASYWMYLVHLPLTIWIPGLLAPLALPAILKFAVVLTSTFAITAGTYHLFVRRTRVGLILNGRRAGTADPARRLEDTATLSP